MAAFNPETSQRTLECSARRAVMYSARPETGGRNLAISEQGNIMEGEAMTRPQEEVFHQTFLDNGPQGFIHNDSCE